MNIATKFKKLLTKKRATLLPVVHDALSAKIAERLGFDAVAVGGFAISGSMYGLPDVGLLSLSDMIISAKHIIQSTKLPVFVDADDGYGNEHSVARTVSEYEKIGAASLFIEDQKHPKRCGHMSGKEIIPASEMVAKMRAAINARQNPDFLICARTDARATNSLNEALRRARLYVQAGADVIFVEAPQSREELQHIPQALPGIPLLVNMLEGGKTPLCTKKELEEWGYKLIAYPVTTLFSHTFAVEKSLSYLKHHGDTQGILSSLTTFDTYKKLVEVENYL